MATTTTSTIIRPRTDADLPECAAILHAVHAISGYPVGGMEDPLRFLRTDDRAWVAVRDADADADDGSSNTSTTTATTAASTTTPSSSGSLIVGHAALSKASERDVAAALWRRLHPSRGGGEKDREEEEEDIMVLGRLFVRPDARGGGVAVRLIETAVAEARGRGARLVLLALVKDQPAIRLYRRLGWSHFGTTVYRWREGGEEREMDGECFVSPE